MQPYKALKEVSLGEAENKVTYQIGTIFEMEAEGEITKELLADGSIEAVPATVDVDHEVTQADLDANPELVEGGVNVGDVITLPMLTKPEDIAQAQAEHEASQKTTPEAVEEAPATPVVAESIPAKFYRGAIIVDEQPRTVGAQTFRHIKTVEGHDYDLTEAEYAAEVTTSK